MAAIDVFAENYGAKYDKAVECPTKDGTQNNAGVLQLYDRALGSLEDGESKAS